MGAQASHSTSRGTGWLGPGGGGSWSEASLLSFLNGWLTSNHSPKRPPKAHFHPCVGVVCGGELVVSGQIPGGMERYRHEDRLKGF